MTHNDGNRDGPSSFIFVVQDGNIGVAERPRLTGTNTSPRPVSVQEPPLPRRLLLPDWFSRWLSLQKPPSYTITRNGWAGLFLRISEWQGSPPASFFHPPLRSAALLSLNYSAKVAELLDVRIFPDYLVSLLSDRIIPSHLRRVRVVESFHLRK